MELPKLPNLPSLSPKQLSLMIGGGLLFVVVVWLVIANPLTSTKPPDVTLEVWGLESRGAMSPLLDRYSKIRPNVALTYREFDSVSYERALLEALASDRGPDVFMISNRELPKEKTRLVPLSGSVLGVPQLRELFPSAVEQDFVSDGAVYALPLYLDTLALVYNADLLDEAGVIAPPKTWNDLQQMVPQLRRLTGSNQVVRAAIALGSTSANVGNAVDILNLLMLQNSVPMTNGDNTAATFALSNQKGVQAFNFYLEFANPSSPSYTWSSTQVDSLDSFASGDVAMVLAYQSSLERIKKRSPFMNMRLALSPQVEGGRSLSYPNYMGFGVSRKSKSSDWGWDFVYYVTTNREAQEAYSASTGHPTALRELIGARVDDPVVGTFARQALTARSWYQVDEREVQRAFNSAIEDVLSGRLDSRRALEQAQDQISKLMETTIRLQKRP